MGLLNSDIITHATRRGRRAGHLLLAGVRAPFDITVARRVRRVIHLDVGVMGDARAIIVEFHHSERLARAENLPPFGIKSTVLALASHRRETIRIILIVMCPIKSHTDIIPRARRDAHYGIIVVLVVRV